VIVRGTPATGIVRSVTVNVSRPSFNLALTVTCRSSTVLGCRRCRGADFDGVVAVGQHGGSKVTFESVRELWVVVEPLPIWKLGLPSKGMTVTV